jgi:hypothetical protein
MRPSLPPLGTRSADRCDSAALSAVPVRGRWVPRAHAFVNFSQLLVELDREIEYRCGRAPPHVFVRSCVRACVRAVVRRRMLACGRACVRACVRAVMRAVVRVFVRSCVRQCVRVFKRSCVCTCVFARELADVGIW